MVNQNIRFAFSGKELTVNLPVAGSHISALYTGVPSVNWMGRICTAAQTRYMLQLSIAESHAGSDSCDDLR